MRYTAGNGGDIMYINYGDRNFFDYGMLVDSEHSDTEFDIIFCRPYDDEEDLYQCGQVTVDINDSWIEKEKVESYIGLKKEDNPIQFAIGCLEYYGAENFGADDFWVYENWRYMTKESICKKLRNYLIASDNLDIEW